MPPSCAKPGPAGCTWNCRVRTESDVIFREESTGCRDACRDSAAPWLRAARVRTGPARAATRVLDGDVEMETEEGLDPAVRAQGYRLLCVGRARGPVRLDA
jgi:hypothetical protein